MQTNNPDPINSAAFKAHSAGRQFAIELMALRLARGQRVIIGTYEHVAPGSSIGSTHDGENILVKRRATREEFLEYAPRGARTAGAMTAPFYWEMELKVEPNANQQS